MIVNGIIVRSTFFSQLLYFNVFMIFFGVSYYLSASFSRGSVRVYINPQEFQFHHSVVKLSSAQGAGLLTGHPLPDALAMEDMDTYC